MRHSNRNLEDFMGAIVRHCIDLSYTNESAAGLLVKLAQEIYANEEYIADQTLGRDTN